MYVAFICAASAASALGHCPLGSASNWAPHPVVARYISSIQHSSTLAAQDRSEQHLLKYVNCTDPAKYSPQQLDSIGQLLADKRVNVRYWIVEALIPFGSRALREAPYLQSAYSDAVCVLIAAHVRRRRGIYDIDAIEGEMFGLKIKPKPALCPSGPEPGAPKRYYDDPLLQLSLKAHAEVVAAEHRRAQH
jgi:hypothetical protein